MATQVLKNTAATLTETFSAGDVDSGNVTVGITRADGSTLVSGAVAGHPGGAGVYTYSLAPQAELDFLTVTWSGTWGGQAQSVQSQVEIVGGFLFPIAAARAFGDKTLNNTSTYPDADIQAARERITDLFDQVTNVSFVPRYARDYLDGTGDYVLRVFRRPLNRLISASIDGVALTSPELADCTVRTSGWLVRKSGAWNWSFTGRNVIVAYEHGFSAPPLDIQRAALILCRYEMVSNDISDRMISFANDLGAVRLSVPGMEYPTGIPAVDSVLARYDETSLILA